MLQVDAYVIKTLHFGCPKPIKPTTPSAASTSSAWNESPKSTLENPNRNPFQKFQEHDSCSVFPKKTLKKLARNQNPKESWSLVFQKKNTKKKSLAVTRTSSCAAPAAGSSNTLDDCNGMCSPLAMDPMDENGQCIHNLQYDSLDCSIKMEIDDDWWRLMVII